MKISEIASKCGYEYCGKDVDVKSVRLAYCAKKDDVAIINNNKMIEQTSAECILLKPDIVMTSKTIIYAAESLELASVKIAEILMQENPELYETRIRYIKNKDYYHGRNVVIGDSTYISPNVYLDNNVMIGSNCFIDTGVHIGSGTVIGNNVRIGSGSYIGAPSFYHYYENNLQQFSGIGNVIICDGVSIGNNTTIQRGTFSDTSIGLSSQIGNLIDIGHDVKIGSNCKIVSQTGIASNVTIGNFVQVFGQVGIANGVTIENNVVIYAKSLVTKDIKEKQKVSGMYARNHIEELRIQAKLRNL